MPIDTGLLPNPIGIPDRLLEIAVFECVIQVEGLTTIKGSSTLGCIDFWLLPNPGGIVHRSVFGHVALVITAVFEMCHPPAALKILNVKRWIVFLETYLTTDYRLLAAPESRRDSTSVEKKQNNR